MALLEWHSYTEAQARERARVLEHLMKERLLTAEEERAAKRLLRQLRARPVDGEVQVYAGSGAEELLQRLEESLWESRKK